MKETTITITVTVANQKFISTKVNNKQSRGMKSILYKSLYYQLPRVGGYSLELFINQLSNLKKYKAAFIQINKEEYACVFINSIRPTIKIELTMLDIHLKRIMETVGEVCFINSIPEGIKEVEIETIKKIPTLIDPFKKRADRRKYIFLSLIFFLIYSVTTILENNFEEETEALNISKMEIEHKLDILKQKNKILEDIPSTEEIFKITKKLVEGVSNER